VATDPYTHGKRDAELAALGSVIVNPTYAADRVFGLLGYDNIQWFGSPETRALYAALGKLHKAGTPIDGVSLASFCDGDILTPTFLSQVMASVPTSANCEYYASVVRDSGLREHVRTRLSAAAGLDEFDDMISRTEEVLDYAHETKQVAMKPADVRTWLTTTPKRMHWVFENMVPRGILVGIVAQGGMGKGWVTETIAISAAIGRTLFPSFEPAYPMPVLWFESEDPEDELHRRFVKICTAYNITSDDEMRLLESNLIAYPGYAMPLAQTTRDGNLIPSRHYSWLESELQRVQPGLLILDPLAHYFGGCDENNNVQMAQFMSFMTRLSQCTQQKTAIWINHHVNKQLQDELSSAAGRGASAGRDAQRSLFAMAPVPEKECEIFGIANPANWVRLAHVKSNWTARTGKTVYLQRDTTTELGGVLREVDLEPKRAEVSHAVIDHAAKRFAENLGPNTDLWTERDIERGIRNADSVWESVGDGKRINKRKIMRYAKKAGYVDDVVMDGKRVLVARAAGVNASPEPEEDYDDEELPF